ncbi:hypothetical protein CRENBAI_004665 [Crenichthys baileyi]|uniref:Uncharacterized protein n=1 Tax=Crenichthys baileyi TaxID=28760 RepID=A0AAV9RBQ9_9TELE
MAVVTGQIPPTGKETVFALPGAKLSNPNPLRCGVEPGDQRADSDGGRFVHNKNQDKKALKLSVSAKEKWADLEGC